MQYAVKPANTARTSTTTLTADPDLQLALAAGTWIFDCVLPFTGGTTGSSDAKITFEFSGTASATGSFWIPFGPTTSSSTVVNNNSTALASTQVIGTYSTTTPVSAQPKGGVVVTAAGTLALYWSQNTSSSTATTAQAGSWLRAIRTA